MPLTSLSKECSFWLTVLSAIEVEKKGKQEEEGAEATTETSEKTEKVEKTK